MRARDRRVPCGRTVLGCSTISCVVHARRRPELLKGVYGMGFNKPSRIQEVALPILIADP